MQFVRQPTTFDLAGRDRVVIQRLQLLGNPLCALGNFTVSKIRAA